MIKKYEQREALGLCHRCGKVPPLLGRKECEGCRIINRDNATQFRIGKKEKGLCRNYCDNPVSPGQSRCFNCLLRERLVTYRIPKEQYDTQMKLQGEKCAICCIPFSDLSSHPNIDHEHGIPSCSHKPEVPCSTCFRSLLCSVCNKGLGLLGDDPDIVIERMQRLKSLVRKA